MNGMEYMKLYLKIRKMTSFEKVNLFHHILLQKTDTWIRLVIYVLYLTRKELGWIMIV
jgi:hypothetical protein